jgi:siroheme synthase
MSNVVVYMGLRHLDRIAAKLADAGMAVDTPAAVIERATRPDQRIIDGTLETIGERARTAGIRAPAVVVVGECVRVRERLTALTRGVTEATA